jgi:DNA-binding response OmpR family regulator
VTGNRTGFQLPKTEATHQPPKTARKRALLVEDDPNERALLAAYLRASGYDVDTACDGQEALEYLAQQKPDAVVMDMEMPRLGGRAVVQKIRADDSLSDVKVFVVSGMEQLHMQIPTGDRGVERWFQKPLCPEELVNELVASLN